RQCHIRQLCNTRRHNRFQCTARRRKSGWLRGRRKSGRRAANLRSQRFTLQSRRRSYLPEMDASGDASRLCGGPQMFQPHAGRQRQVHRRRARESGRHEHACRRGDTARLYAPNVRRDGARRVGHGRRDLHRDTAGVARPCLALRHRVQLARITITLLLLVGPDLCTLGADIAAKTTVLDADNAAQSTPEIDGPGLAVHDVCVE
ncbi:hypothetical protein LTR16_009634, partial [Cryomyces antarcticus]